MPSSTNYQRAFGIFSLILLTATQSLALINQDVHARARRLDRDDAQRSRFSFGAKDCKRVDKVWRG